MKRLIPAALLSALIIAVGFMSSFTVLKTVNDFNSEIESCEYFYNKGEYKTAFGYAEKFRSGWLAASKRLSAYTNHGPVDDIGILASMLPEAAKQNNGFEFASITGRIKAELRIIKKEQSFNPENFY